MAISCKECRYFEPNTDKRNGICCRYPAVPVATVSQEGSGGDYYYTSTVEYHQPIMYEAEWCGEFRPAFKPLSAEERIANKCTKIVKTT